MVPIILHLQDLQELSHTASDRSDGLVVACRNAILSELYLKWIVKWVDSRTKPTRTSVLPPALLMFVHVSAHAVVVVIYDTVRELFTV